MKAARNIRLTEEREVESLYNMVMDAAYPCLGAKGALANERMHCFVAHDMREPSNDYDIINFLYTFIEGFRRNHSALSSAVVIFSHSAPFSENDFEECLWERLQALADIDSTSCAYDTRVSSDPSSPQFSFSLNEEALYVIGLHPNSSRKARRFLHPALVFNPHQQFDSLRSSGKYDRMKGAIRRRDVDYSGSVNPMLSDFGTRSEAIQYSGKEYGNNWKCPFVSRHQRSDDHSAEDGRSASAE